MHGFHHLRKRVRISHGLEPFPARTFWLRALDALMYVVAFIAPLALVPQIMEIYGTKSAAGVSLATWLALGVVNILWTIYAAVHRDKVLFLASILIALFDLVIVVGIFLY